MRFVAPRRLRDLGVVGMNRRNVSCVQALNRRAYFPRVDDKLITKVMAIEAGIRVPELLAVLRYQGQVKELEAFLADQSEFVIKPSMGCAGRGILVIVGRKDGGYVKPSGAVIRFPEIARHVSNLLSGLYSLGGQPDKALVEGLVHFTDAFDAFTFQGVPDVRVIIYKGYPLMAMMRLSTSMSDGKANLHQGAVGVGIDLRSGRALEAVQFDRSVDVHPDTGVDLMTLAVPEWDEVVMLATRCFDVVDMGYLGADVVLDREEGPMILELNARPGLAIQVANGFGMLPRMRAIDAVVGTHADAAERVRFAIDAFCPV